MEESSKFLLEWVVAACTTLVTEEHKLTVAIGSRGLNPGRQHGSGRDFFTRFYIGPNNTHFADSVWKLTNKKKNQHKKHPSVSWYMLRFWEPSCVEELLSCTCQDRGLGRPHGLTLASLNSGGAPEDLSLLRCFFVAMELLFFPFFLFPFPPWSRSSLRGRDRAVCELRGQQHDTNDMYKTRSDVCGQSAHDGNAPASRCEWSSPQSSQLGS